MDTTSDEKDGKAVEKSESCTESRRELNNSMPGFDLIYSNDINGKGFLRRHFSDPSMWKNKRWDKANIFIITNQILDIFKYRAFFLIVIE